MIYKNRKKTRTYLQIVHISQTTLLFDTISLNKSVFTRGHSLGDIANSKNFYTLRGNFKGIDVKMLKCSLLIYS